MPEPVPQVVGARLLVRSLGGRALNRYDISSDESNWRRHAAYDTFYDLADAQLVIYTSRLFFLRRRLTVRLVGG